MGRARGQRPLRPRGAVERVALVGGGWLSRPAATRTPPWGSHPWTTEDGGACGAGENNRRAGDTHAVRDEASLAWPARRGLKTGKALRAPPAGRFRKTHRAERRSESKRYFLQSFRAQPGAPRPSPHLQRPFRVKRRSRAFTKPPPVGEVSARPTEGGVIRRWPVLRSTIPKLPPPIAARPPPPWGRRVMRGFSPACRGKSGSPSRGRWPTSRGRRRCRHRRRPATYRRRTALAGG